MILRQRSGNYGTGQDVCSVDPGLFSRHCLTSTLLIVNVKILTTRMRQVLLLMSYIPDQESVVRQETNFTDAKYIIFSCYPREFLCLECTLTILAP